MDAGRADTTATAAHATRGSNEKTTRVIVLAAGVAAFWCRLDSVAHGPSRLGLSGLRVGREPWFGRRCGRRAGAR
jgi:hypothetical protein